MNKEILEGNKLIANFMGLETKVNSRGSLCTVPDEDLQFDYIAYHSSWDWLMPVVEKISKIPIPDRPVIFNGEDTFYDTYFPRTFGMMNSETNEYLVRINTFALHYSKSLITATYEAVVEFIKWYNLNQPTH